jgi:hypothetical protein
MITDGTAVQCQHVRVTTTTLSWDVVPVDKPDDVNVVIGQAHFIKTVEDLHEAMVGVSQTHAQSAASPQLIAMVAPRCLKLSERTCGFVGSRRSLIQQTPNKTELKTVR